MLPVRNTGLLRRYYEKAFDSLQQINCRILAKAYIKLVEPRKQVNYPYNGRKIISGSSQQFDPELTKPAWWPAGVTHREPDHLLKAGVFYPRFAPCISRSNLGNRTYSPACPHPLRAA